MSYLELWQPSCSEEQNNLCNFGRGHYGEHSCEFIINLDQLFRRRRHFMKKFLKDDTKRPIKNQQMKSKLTQKII